MKKIVITVVGLLVVSLFLVGCAKERIEVVDEEGNLVGEAMRYGNRFQFESKGLCTRLEKSCGFGVEPDVELECETFKPGLAVGYFDSAGIGYASQHDYCKDQDYDVCVSANVIGLLDVAGTELKEVVFPAGCDSPTSEVFDRTKEYRKLINPPTGGQFSSGEHYEINCCRTG